jgi:hypothetical protein
VRALEIFRTVRAGRVGDVVAEQRLGARAAATHAGVPTAFVEERVVGDGEHPRGDGATRRVEALGGAPELHLGLLEGVVRALPADRRREQAEHDGVAGHDPRERLFVPASNARERRGLQAIVVVAPAPSEQRADGREFVTAEAGDLAPRQEGADEVTEAWGQVSLTLPAPAPSGGQSRTRSVEITEGSMACYRMINS